MSFLAPLFLAGAAAAAVPVILHLLERHTERRVRFAAVALLKDAPVEHAARRRLRQWLLLALRVAALVLLAAVFARPFFPAASARGGRLTVVALDTSLSMAAPAQMARARQRARDAVRNAPAGDDVAVVTFADRADVAVPPTASRGIASAAIDAAHAGFGSTSYRAAIAAANQLFRGRPGTLAVVTDLQANGWDSGERTTLSDRVHVEVFDVGALPENLAVTDVHAEGDRVVAVVVNAGTRPREARASLTIEGRTAGAATVQVGAHDSAEAVFADVHETGIAQVSIDDREGIAGDNARYAFVGGASTASVLVVTTNGDLDKDAWYVRHALDVGAAVPRRPEIVGVAAGQLGAWSADRLRRFASVIVLSSRGLERPARERLAAYAAGGGGLVLAAGPDVDGEVISDVLGAPSSFEMKAAEPATVSMTPADARHPIFRSFGAEIASLALVRFQRVARVSGADCQPIARFTSGDTAVLDCAVGSGRAVILASDLGNRWNDFPVRASFVPFIDQTVRYVSNNRARALEYFAGDVPAGVAPEPGVRTIADDRGSRRVIVNVDPRESELDRMSASDFDASIARLKEAAEEHQRADATDQENRQHLWQYLAGAVALVLLAEGMAAARAA
jgi:hypothetical protein